MAAPLNPTPAANAGDKIEKIKQIAKIIYPYIYTSDNEFSETDAEDLERELQYLPKIINLLEWALKNVNKVEISASDELKFYDKKTGYALYITLAKGRGAQTEVVVYPDANTIYVLVFKAPVLKILKRAKKALEDALKRYTKAQQIL
ncbi:hypothetical protein STSV2_03 [Sulfolobus virus STSV2]|uniref:hypothetical protein n=1 Tax=Sulfolobus virus STSV2 TaxID=1123964 RepID=UPI0002A840CB|nr:hypothetical protein STSV2_03 [Sulfolobus virus STSV2]AFU91982.1 hypothetical protein STSV2_03 [Sulfolobus virus STSV2]